MCSEIAQLRKYVVSCSVAAECTISDVVREVSAIPTKRKVTRLSCTTGEVRSEWKLNEGCDASGSFLECTLLAEPMECYDGFRTAKAQ